MVQEEAHQRVQEPRAQAESLGRAEHARAQEEIEESSHIVIVFFAVIFFTETINLFFRNIGTSPVEYLDYFYY